MGEIIKETDTPICIREINENIKRVFNNEALTRPLATLNRNCEFKKRYDVACDLKEGNLHKKWDKEYYKEYRQRPEVKAKNKEYHQRPEIKAKNKEYRQRPEIKAKNKEYYQRPEVKAKNKEYYQRPEVKAKNKEYHQRPEIKLRQKEYQQRPEVKQKNKEKRRERYKKLRKFQGEEK